MRWSNEEMAVDETWVRLYSEVRAFKNGLPSDAQIKHRGFSIFFAPPRHRQILLVGLNPSRSDSSYATKYPEAEATFPADHLYSGERGGRLSKALSSMLIAGSDDTADLANNQAWQEILNGTKINSIFFGSKNWTEWCNERFWGSGGHALRREVERRCDNWTTGIIRSIPPSKIICEGFAAFDRICEMFETIPKQEYVSARPGRGNQRLFSRNRLSVDGEIVPILGILHPTGGRGRTKEETIVLGKEIISFLS